MARLNSIFQYVDREETLYFSSFDRAKDYLDKNVADYRAKGAQLLASKPIDHFAWRAKIHFPWSGRIFEVTIEEIELDIIPSRSTY